MSDPTERTAAEAFAARRASIDAQLERLRKVLAAFDTWHKNIPEYWGVVGDAKAVEVALANILVGCEAAETWLNEGWGKTGGAS